MKSHAILRTNVALTTNAKIMVDSEYRLYVDAIISNAELSSNQYKKKEFNKDNYLDELIPFFFKETPSDIAYFIRDDDDNKNVAKSFSNQFDDTYQYGARNIIENKDYIEEFEYFAPLHISKTGLPTNFAIFRVDGPGIINLNRENFRTEILNKLKCIKIFDLTRATPLGEWLDRNITKNKNFPPSGLFIDFRNLEFSSWFGIDYEDGGYSEKSLMLDETLSKERTYQDFEKFVIDGYKNKKVIYPNIINFSFLFDDNPATPSSLRTWSLNRYMGFYLDNLELVRYVSPNLIPRVKDDAIIDDNNLIYSASDINPFVETFKTEENIYIEIEGEFYKIEKFLEQQPAVLSRVEIARNTFEEKPDRSFLTRYKIISEKNLSGKQNVINKNIIKIESSNGLNKLNGLNGESFIIEQFDDSDVWLIQIDGSYHNIVKNSDGQLLINADYAFSQSLDKFDYYINDPDPNYRKSLSLRIDEQNPPKKFGIYRCKFTDIKDFDTDIVDTEYSKFEYIQKEKLTDTDEVKMYVVNQNSTASPKDFDDFKINGQVVNIPASSEYTANSELFRIDEKDLNFLWKKNAKRVKWGFQNSISSNDYPYLLNNSFLSEDYNRTVNPYDPSPSRSERNMDYFLTINTDSNEYQHHSLHVIDENTITFNKISSEFGTFTKLEGISEIAYFNINDMIQINSESFYYNTSSRILNINYSSNLGWSIILDLTYQSVSGTVSGQISNLTRTSFCLNKYLNLNYQLDYFDYFFGKKTKFEKGEVIKNTKKYSQFNTGDNSIPNTTLFRGLKYKVWEVAGLKVTESKIEAINIKSSNIYEDYKFAVLASKNNFVVNSLSDGLNGATVSYSSNNLKWIIIDEWKHDKIYQKDDIVKWNESIYIALTQSQIVDPNSYPFDSSDWTIYTQKNIFWNSIVDGTSPLAAKNNMLELGQTLTGDSSVVIPPLVFNHNEYYYSSGRNGNNFWNPLISYDTGDVVLYKDKIWISNEDNNTEIPSNDSVFILDENYKQWWRETSTNSTIWTSVEMWDSQIEYLQSNSSWDSSVFSTTRGHYVVYEDVVYLTVDDTSRGVPPDMDIRWRRVYSLKQDTKFAYNNSLTRNGNPIFSMNNRLYLCRENGYRDSGVGVRNLIGTSTLENGITIYVNKKWKNILVNIYINDNTYTSTVDLGFGSIAFKKDSLSKNKVDNLYTDIYSKLSANNFMNAVNDLSNFYGFSDKIRYVIINEDLSIKIHDFNDLTTVENLPVLLTCEGPDEFLVNINSLKVSPSTLSVSEIKPKRELVNGEITALSQINYYSDSNLATSISQIEDDPVKVPNYSGLKNNLYNNLFRHSGYYSPIFHNIELFRAATFTQSSGNYKFDTELTNFGKIKERIVSKVNRGRNILKLRNNADLLSIYPMLDEFGYHTISSFIFKSTWDVEYHIECNDVAQVEIVRGNQSLQFIPQENKTINSNLDLL